MSLPLLVRVSQIHPTSVQCPPGLSIVPPPSLNIRPSSPRPHQKKSNRIGSLQLLGLKAGKLIRTCTLVVFAMKFEEKLEGPVLDKEFEVVTLVAPGLIGLLVGIELRVRINTKSRYRDCALF